MKKLAVLLFVMASMIFIVPAAEARTTNAAESADAIQQRHDRQRRQQRRGDRRDRRRDDRRYDRDNDRRYRQNQRYRNRRYERNRRYDRRNNRYSNRGRVYTAYQTRYVRRGRWLYRETYRVMRLPNGRVNTRLINRVRVRRY